MIWRILTDKAADIAASEQVDSAQKHGKMKIWQDKKRFNNRNVPTKWHTSLIFAKKWWFF